MTELKELTDPRLARAKAALFEDLSTDVGSILSPFDRPIRFTLQPSRNAMTDETTLRVIVPPGLADQLVNLSVGEPNDFFGDQFREAAIGFGPNAAIANLHIAAPNVVFISFKSRVGDQKVDAQDRVESFLRRWEREINIGGSRLRAEVEAYRQILAKERSVVVGGETALADAGGRPGGLQPLRASATGTVSIGVVKDVELRLQVSRSLSDVLRMLEILRTDTRLPESAIDTITLDIVPIMNQLKRLFESVVVDVNEADRLRGIGLQALATVRGMWAGVRRTIGHLRGPAFAVAVAFAGDTIEVTDSALSIWDRVSIEGDSGETTPQNILIDYNTEQNITMNIQNVIYIVETGQSPDTPLQNADRSISSR